MDDQCNLVFRAMGDKTRWKIMELLKKREQCVSEICAHFHMSQPSISHHLDILKRAGLVESEKRGREVFYRLNADTVIDCCGRQFKLFDIKLTRSE